VEPASDIELMQGRSDYVSECLEEKKVYTEFFDVLCWLNLVHEVVFLLSIHY